jgi:protein TonB
MLWAAVAAAITMHVGVLLFVALPEMQAPFVSVDRTTPPKITPYIPPPPPIEPPRRLPPTPDTRMMPLPDPDPETPEPIREPSKIEIELFPPPELPVDPGEPEPPPRNEPKDPGFDNVTPPVLVQRVEPIYPELPRRAGLPGEVVLRAVILEDGEVVEIEVLRCNRPNLGFEDAAIRAVSQWRYEPATQFGRSVAVYVTVYVTFTLH